MWQGQGSVSSGLTNLRALALTLPLGHLRMETAPTLGYQVSPSTTINISSFHDEVAMPAITWFPANEQFPASGP